MVEQSCSQLWHIIFRELGLDFMKTRHIHRPRRNLGVHSVLLAQELHLHPAPRFQHSGPSTFPLGSAVFAFCFRTHV